MITTQTLKSTLVSIAAAIIVATCAPADAGESERRPFRRFALETFSGDSLELADLRGKVSLVIFWASWCPACQATLPVVDSLFIHVEHPEFAVVGVNEDWNEHAARGYAASNGFAMPIVLGRGEMWQRYQYIGLPYIVLLDRTGRIVHEYYGYPGRSGFDQEIAGRAVAELQR